MNKFYKDLKVGLEEIIAYKQGKIELRSASIEIPEPSKKDVIKNIKIIYQKKKDKQ